MKSKKILFIIVVFLFIISIIQTCRILNINFQKEKNESSESTEKEISEKEIPNNYNNNGFQTNEIGKSLFCDQFIYFGDENYLVKYDASNDSYYPILTGLNIKNITDANENIICTTTIENGNTDLKDYVNFVSKDGNDSCVYYKTESPFITSLTYDGTFVYYTNESNDIYKLNLETKEVETFFSNSKKNDFPKIIGIFNSELLYVDGNSISSININTMKKQIISNQYSNYLLKPVIYNDSLYLFNDFTYKDIVKINLSNYKDEIIYSDIENINNFNIVDNYLILNINNNISYVKLNEKEKKQYKYIDSSEVNITDDSLYYIKNNKIIINPINWILSK